MSLLSIVVAAAGLANAECAADLVQIRNAQGVHSFEVSLADTPHSRARGLMFVQEMAPDAGMLFVYDAPHHAYFWMRNTYLPLDMLFVGADGRIRSVHSDAVPLDETVIDGGDEVQYVLEINAGQAKALDLAAGDVLRHPAVPSDLAVWPCE